MARKKKEVETISSMLEGVNTLLDDVFVDAEKFDNGNASAGKRVRKNLQEIKKMAQAVRIEIQERKNAAK